MTKTLKELFEVYKPKSPDEQKFVDKHVTIKHKDRNGNGDDVFKGNTKYNKRKEERHGYDVGEDEKVYEEVEEIDELSKNTMLRYVSANKKSDKAAQEKGDYSKTDRRMRGTDMAVRKYTATDNKYVRVPATEEVEIEEKTLTPAEMKKREEIAKAMERENPGMDKSKKMAIATATAKRVAEEVEDLDELSNTTLGSYVKKATNQAFNKGFAGGANLSRGQEHEKEGERQVNKAVKRVIGVNKAVNKMTKEEVEDLDETAKIVAHLQKRYGDNIRKSHVRSAANDFGVGYTGLAHAVRKKLGVVRLEEDEQVDEMSSKMKMKLGLYGKKKKNEEVEQVDEISTKLALDYMDKASDASGHKNLSTPKLDKRYKSVALAHKKIGGRGVTVQTNEEADQIDELSKNTMGSYVKKASGAERPKNVMSPKSVPITTVAAYQGDSETGHFGKRFNQATYDKAERLRKNRETGIKRAVDKITKEEVEQVDEISKSTMGRYINKAKDSIDMAAYRQGGVEARGSSSRPLEKKLTKRHKGIETAVKKLTKEDSINRAIQKFMPELEDYKPMTQEEKLVAKLDGLSEATIHLLLNLFENLNKDNRTKMLYSIDTKEGINSLVDFALTNRGE